MNLDIIFIAFSICFVLLTIKVWMLETKINRLISVFKWMISNRYGEDAAREADE